MGNPRFVAGVSYQVGTCKAQGFAARPAGYTCQYASKIQSYCDSADPYCCNGSDANTHQGYGQEYGQAALTFIKSKLSASGSGSTTPTTTSKPAIGPSSTSKPSTQPTTTSTPPSGGNCAAKYGQCGGQG